MPDSGPHLHTHRDGTVSQVVSGDDLRVGDVLRTSAGEVSVVAIGEKPRTRALTLMNASTGEEQPYRVRRSTQLLIVPRQAYEVRAMLDSYGPVIQDALLVRDLNQARRTANSMFSDPRIEWVEIVEVQWPGPDGDFDYVDCGHREKLQRPDS